MISWNQGNQHGYNMVRFGVILVNIYWYLGFMETNTIEYGTFGVSFLTLTSGSDIQ